MTQYELFKNECSAEITVQGADPKLALATRAWMDQALAADNPLALRAEARRHARARRHADSIGLYQRLVAHDPFDLAAQMELYVVRVKAGQAEAASAALAEVTGRFKWLQWPAPITSYYLGKLPLEQLLTEAGADKQLAQRRTCEVYRHAHALQHALQQASAKPLAQRARAECDIELDRDGADSAED